MIKFFLPLLLGINFSTSGIIQQNSLTENSCNEASVTEPVGRDNVAYKWGYLALQATANDTEKFNPRPTITSRYLALIFTAVFDAWSRYDEKAIPVYLENVERRPENESNLKNKEIAISYAALRTMSEYYYSDKEMFREFMLEMGLNPENESMDPSTPVGIGNLAAKAVIDARRNDGANQYGEVGDSNGRAYFDYSGSETAELAGISMVLGGYHIQSDIIAGFELGRKVAHETWEFYKKYIGEK